MTFAKSERTTAAVDVDQRMTAKTRASPQVDMVADGFAGVFILDWLDGSPGAAYDAAVNGSSERRPRAWTHHNERRVPRGE